MTSDSRTFTATLRAGDRGGAYIDIPFDVEAEYGSNRVPIRATIDGEPYRGSLVRMGGGLAVALAKDANAAKFFDSLSYTHRREYVQWIEEARREETRARRVSRTVEMLREGRRGRQERTSASTSATATA